jgi:hypothetical protein
MNITHRQSHNGRGKVSPLGGVHNAPQQPVQGKPTVPSNTEIPPELLAQLQQNKPASV